jgi:multidrug efflux system outer membrane protein
MKANVRPPVAPVSHATSRRVRPRCWPMVQGLGMALTVMLVVVGCTVGPNFQPPQLHVPTQWSPYAVAETPPPATPTQPSVAVQTSVPVSQWWQTFNDAELDTLIARATHANLDLRLAQERILQARAARGVAVAAQWPTVNATGAYTHSQTSGGTVVGTAVAPQPTNLFQVGFDASWEVDIFGGVRRSVEAATADIQAAIEDHRNVMVTLLAEVASNYVQVRGAQRQLAIAQQNLAAQQRTAEITRRRLIGGLAAGLDLANAEAQAATTAAQLPLLETQAQQAIYSLSVLLGLEPTALTPELSTASPIPVTPPQVPVGLPADLLRRRPDLRRAEAQIHAATARIGVATADLFPRFSLTGSGGLASSTLLELGHWTSRFFSVGPSVSWPIFDAGRIRATIQVQDALTQQALTQYQKTVLTALQDVENALVAYAKEQARRQSLTDAVTANRRAVDLANRLYTQGLTNFLNVLDAERSLYTTEDALVQSQRNISLDLLALYKALGGGWELTAQYSDGTVGQP